MGNLTKTQKNSNPAFRSGATHRLDDHDWLCCHLCFDQ